LNTCIIIPCYNEFDRLPVSEFLSYISINEIFFCFVNDGSSDDTLALLNSIQTKFPEKVTVISSEMNAGKAETIRIAVLQLIINPDISFIGFFDADLATPLSEISFLLRKIKNNDSIDLIMGSRIKRLGGVIKRKYSRFLFGRIFATIVSEYLLKLPIYDTQCGAKIFRKNVFINIFDEPFITNWIFDVEILLRLKEKYCSKFLEKNVYEFPLNYWEEKGGSKIKFIDFFKVPKDIINLKIKYKN